MLEGPKGKQVLVGNRNRSAAGGNLEVSNIKVTAKNYTDSMLNLRKTSLILLRTNSCHEPLEQITVAHTYSD